MIVGATHPGRVRTRNEDAFHIDPARGLVVVADGLGGHAAGDVASRLAVDTFVASVPWQARFGYFRRDALVAAVVAANRAVHEAAAADAARAGMGSTLVAALIRGRSAALVHVGDSRAYRLRYGELTCLTEDHVWPAPDGTPSNVLTRALGSEPTVQVDAQTLEIVTGDRLLLCSDGLSRTTSDAEIAALLQQHAAAEPAVAALIEAALAHGAPDNVTVVVVDL